MIKDINPLSRETVSPIKGMRTIVDTRDYIIADHIIDSIARGYALEVLSQRSLTTKVTPKITRHLTKVTYG